jgi:hypothetical protein
MMLGLWLRRTLRTLLALPAALSRASVGVAYVTFPGDRQSTAAERLRLKRNVQHHTSGVFGHSAGLPEDTALIRARSQLVGTLYSW